MKIGVTALGLVEVLSFSGFSQAETLSRADKDFLFGSQSVQTKTISVKEMKDTNGEFLPFGVAPIISGAIYTGTSLYKGNFLWYGLGWAVAGGFIGPYRYGYIAQRLLSQYPKWVKWYVSGHGTLTNAVWQQANPWK